MSKGTLLAGLTIVCFYVQESYTDCFSGHNEVVNGTLEQNVTLSCILPEQCDDSFWRNETTIQHVPDGTTSHTSVYRDGHKISLDIFRISLDDSGAYTCWCQKDRQWVGNPHVCSVTVTTICQLTVFLNGEAILYNSSLSNSHDVNVAKGQRIKITCPEGADSNTTCSDVAQKDSSEFTYSFKVRRKHNSCRIVCQVRRNEEVICSVNFALNVSTIETSGKPLTVSTRPTVSSKVSTTVSTTVSDAASTTSAQPVTTNTTVLTTSAQPVTTNTTTTVSTISAQPVTTNTTVSTTSAQLVTTKNSTTISAGTHARADTTIKYVQKKKQDATVTDTPGSFPVIIPVGILVFILVGVSFVLCFYIFSSRSKSNSRSNKKIKRVNSFSDDSIPIGPTYATVDKSSDRCEKGDDDSMKEEVPCTDDFYSEVNNARNVNPTTQQANPARTETSFTYEHYSGVNISNAELDSKEDGAKNDSNLYSKVEKKQPRQKEPSKASSGDSVQSSQTDQVVEQPNSYHNETVGDTSTAQVLYTVVDKEKK